MTHNEILSSIGSLTTSDFVYSSLSFYAKRRGAELPGLWFVRALGALGVEEMAVRQTLYRMERSGALEARTEGREKLYRASATSLAVMDVGQSRILGDDDEKAWDRRWTLVRFVLDGDERKVRDRLRDILTVEGFAALGSGLYAHPRPRADRILQAAEGLGLQNGVHVFRGDRIGGSDDRAFASCLWDLPSVGARYRRFLRRFVPLEEEIEGLDPREAFGVRFALVFEYLRITWEDPDLPAPLLPTDWPGDQARDLARRLYLALLPGAMAFGDEILDTIGAAMRAEVRDPTAGS